jgi:isopropylmalate/homocitrate/citramalate synthase
MDAVTLVDTMGACSPAAIRYFVRRVRQRFPEAQLEAHFHDDFGLATANTLEALALGVQVAHVSVCGIGERAGGAALEDVVVALKTLYGVETAVKTEKLYELCQVVLDRTGHPIPPNKSVAGRALFDVESGIPATWLRRCGEKLLTEVFPLHPDLIGQSQPRIVLGKGCGDESVRQWLEDMGAQATPEQVSRLTALVKDFSLAKKDLLTRREFATLVRWVLED